MVLQTEFAQIKGNDLYIDDVKATDLVKQYGTPLYVMSEGHIRKQFNTLKTKMIDKYENTLPLFASKSFSCKAIYKLSSLILQLCDLQIAPNSFLVMVCNL